MWRKRTGSSVSPHGDAMSGDALASWRERQLLRAGFNADLAASIAAESAIDLHALIELVERGCPPALALRILAPLDQARDPC
jgi:hypothetical protein